VLFNEDYVDLMYRMAGRDLSLMLYDRNNRPLRDPSGRVAVRDNPWGVAEQLTLSTKDDQWLKLLDGSGCVIAVDHMSIPHDLSLTAAGPGQLLDRDTLYSARLVPLLRHEDFGELAALTSASGPGSKLGRWHIEDIGTGGPSQWRIEQVGTSAAHRVTQTSGVNSPPVGGDPAPLGTLLVLDDDPALTAGDAALTANWSDCRIGLYLRGAALTGSIGLALRYGGVATFYLVMLDFANARRKLIAIAGGSKTVLADDAFTPIPNRDYHLVIEAIGPSLRGYLDDAPLFDVSDTTIAKGGIALCCNDNAGAAFSDIQVHDLSSAAHAVYGFSFVTSAFIDFFHHLHGFDDHCWTANTSLSASDLATVFQRAVADVTAAISDEEARAFERLAEDALGSAARQPAARTELTTIQSQGTTAALLFRSPEPLDWRRVTMALSTSARAAPPALIAGPAKLVAAALGAQQPKDESISLLVREALDLSGYRIDKRDLSGAPPNDPSPPALDDPASGWVTLYQFGAETMAADGSLVMIYSCGPDTAPPAVPGTSQRFRAATGQPGDVRLAEDAVDLRLVAPDGQVSHARRFLNDSLYAPAQINLLRKADGTACFIIPVGTSAGLGKGSYRLAAQFRRRNTAVDPDSVVLSENGRTDPESASLDFAF
jgi:hypothetical protein